MLQGVKTQFFPAGPRKKSDLVQLEKIEFLPPRAKKLGSFLAGLSKIFSLLTIWPIFFWVNRVKKDVKNSQMEPFSRGIFTLRTWQKIQLTLLYEMTTFFNQTYQFKQSAINDIFKYIDEVLVEISTDSNCKTARFFRYSFWSYEYEVHSMQT